MRHFQILFIFLSIGLTSLCQKPLNDERTQEVKPITVLTDKTESAASTAVLSPLLLFNRPKNSAQDLLRVVPGLFIAQHAGGGKAEQIFIRGFDCDHGTDIATFVDGMPVNMPSHGHGQGYADLHFLIPELVENINVFKGCSSVNFGDFATGAAVGFKTLDSLTQQKVGIDLAYLPTRNQLASQRIFTLLALPSVVKNQKSYIGMEAIGSRGYFDKGQHLQRYNAFVKSTFQLQSNRSLQVSLSGFSSKWDASGQIPTRAVASGLIDRFGFIDPNEGGSTARYNLNMLYKSGAKKTKFEWQAYAIKYQFQLFSNFTFFQLDPLQGDMIEQNDQRIVAGMQFKWKRVHSIAKHTALFTAGVVSRNDWIENQLWHAPARVHSLCLANYQIASYSQSLFVNESILLWNGFRLDLGLRYDQLLVNAIDQISSSNGHTNQSGSAFQNGLHPKFNLSYNPSTHWQFFLNSGSGYHSNDARGMILSAQQHALPLAISTELGMVHKQNKTNISLALWELEMSNELVYIGDEGGTEDRGSSRRLGLDLSIRSNLFQRCYFDIDVNYAYARFTQALWKYVENSSFYIPLAPILTSAGGFSWSINTKLDATIRYRYLMSRPANENASVIAKGYQILDFQLNYNLSHWKWSVSIENLLNTAWNEAQFATTSQLLGESQAIEELNFTPGSPFSLKIGACFLFK